MNKFLSHLKIQTKNKNSNEKKFKDQNSPKMAMKTPSKLSYKA
jgi:hypothetical protein